MPKSKRHLIWGARRKWTAACGLRDPQHWTDDPAHVTCGGCKKTVAMADAEVAKITKQTRK